jgi:hypothetical protein
LCLWFKYKFNEGADKDKLYAIWNKMIEYYRKDAKEFGSVMMNFAWAYTDDGWEAWETFPNAEAFEKHCANTMNCPLIGDVFASQSMFTEVAHKIQGPESEINKAPSMKEYYPNHKFTF